MSFASIALAVAGAAVAVLAVTGILVVALPVAPGVRVGIAVVGVVLAVVAMGVASSKMTDRAIRSQFGPEPDEAEGAGGADRAGFGPDGPAD